MHTITSTTCVLSRMLILLGSIFCITDAMAEIKLSFGVYTADKPTIVVKKFKPLLNILETSLTRRLSETVKIKLQIANTYDSGIDNLTSGRVDFARLGPASYVVAKKQQPDLDILVLESKKGKKRSNGVICVRADSPIKTISDLKAKRFAFGDEKSTIGRYLAQLYLFEQGLKAKDLGIYNYLDRHDKVGAAVASAQYDAGALKESTFERLVKNGASLRVLATFTNVTKPWIARADLEQNITLALQTTLLNLKDPKALAALRKDGFVEGNDKDYEVIRKAIELNPNFFK